MADQNNGTHVSDLRFEITFDFYFYTIITSIINIDFIYELLFHSTHKIHLNRNKYKIVYNFKFVSIL